MTMIEIIAMIATGVLCVLCVICIAALFSSKRQAKENKRAIKDIRDRLGTFGDSINEKTDQLFERLDKQQSDGIDERRLEALEEEIRQLAKVEEEIASAVSAAEAGAVTVEDDFIETDDIEELDDEIDLDDLFRELSAMSAAEPELGTAEEFAEEPVREPLPPIAQPEPAVQPQMAVPQQVIPQQQEIQQQEIQQRPAVQPQPMQTQQELPEEQPRKATRYHQGYNIGRSGRKYTAEELNVLIRE